MNTIKEAFLKAIKNFPSWMDIRKRPEKSNGALYLKSIIEEQKGIEKELDTFIKEHFIVTYVGKEDTVLEKIKAVQIGTVDISSLSLISPNLDITEDARLFLHGDKEICLYQNGYLIFNIETVLEQYKINDETYLDKIIYSVNNDQFSSYAQETRVWNIIDEFALFLGIERFLDEDNRKLMKRCFSVFQNRTNSTEVGLKNTIINSLSGLPNIEIEPEDITIEQVNENNIRLTDVSGEQIYEKLAVLNKDTFRTKIWNLSNWENSFKTLMYSPHQWDKKIELYQDGVGQRDDLNVIINNGSADTADVSISAYKLDREKIIQYVQKSNISTDIGFTLEKYNNEIKTKRVLYQIRAAKAVKINPASIYFTSKQKVTGIEDFYLENIITNSYDAEVYNNGTLETPGKYKLRFFPKSLDGYCSMEISKMNLVDSSGATTSLLSPNSSFDFKDGIFSNINVLAHVQNINKLKNYTKVENGKNCIKMLENAMTSTLSMDITGMDNNYIVIKHSAPKENISTNTAYIKSNGGFSLTENKTWISKSGIDYCSMNISLKCSAISFSLAENENKDKQGSINVEVYINGDKKEEYSGIWTKFKTCDITLSKMSDIVINIEKIGMHAVEIKDILVNRYEVESSLDYENFIETSFGKRLPKTGKTNTLRIRIDNYGTTIPQIDYIHVGPSLKNASYTSEEFESDGTSYLQINSNCRVQLLKVEDGKNILLKDNYDTHMSYKNNTNRNILMEVDVNFFENIIESSIPIKTTVEGNRKIHYITLPPRKEFSTIEIHGGVNKTLSRQSLLEIFKIKPDQELYISKNSLGFILKDNITQEEKIVKINGNLYKKEADVFFYENIPNDCSGYFISDSFKGNLVKANSINSTFEESYIAPNDETEHLALNEVSMISSHKDRVKIVNTFSPELKTENLMFYSLVPPENRKVDIKFEKNVAGKISYSDWSLGIKPYGITVNIDLDYSNSESYGKDSIRLQQTFVLSNTIDLEESYIINGTKQSLSTFVITPDAGLSIQYKTSDDVGDYGIIIEEDGFNKLYYSNIISILHVELEDTGEIIPSEMYSLLGKEGIIIWNSTTLNKKSIIGRAVTVVYKYNIPVALTYDDISYLYEQVNYSIDAYSIIDGYPKKYRNINVDQNVPLLFEENPARIIIKCLYPNSEETNPALKASYSNGQIKIIKLTDFNTIAIHSGYYYDDGEEYYFFANDYKEEVKNSNRVQFIEVNTYGTTLYLEKSASNFIRNSYFNKTKKETICNINCINNEDLNSSFNMCTITACETFSLWKIFDTDVAIVNGINEKALSFNSLNDSSYSLIEITQAVIPDNIISLYASGNLKIKLMKEILVDGDSLSKTTFCKEYRKFEKHTGVENYLYVKIPADIQNVRYYLLITGSGVLDDIISKKCSETEALLLHRKNISKLGLSIEETYDLNYKILCDFNMLGSQLQNTELSEDNYITTDTSIDWGFTKIYDIKDDYDNCIIRNIKKRNDAFYAEGEDGQIKTPAIYIPNNEGINRIFIKINDIVYNSYENFHVSIYTSDSKDSSFDLKQSIENSNLIEIKNNIIDQYMQILVEMKEGKVINSLEIYAEYAETSLPPILSEHTTGSLITKVYDMGSAANYSLMAINGSIIGNVNIYIRGLKSYDGRFVWTSWYTVTLDENNNVVNPHEFENYEMFQFKINIENSDSKCLIDNFVMEVTSRESVFT